jgi:hypothetical protein
MEMGVKVPALLTLRLRVMCEGSRSVLVWNGDPSFGLVTNS